MRPQLHNSAPFFLPPNHEPSARICLFLVTRLSPLKKWRLHLHEATTNPNNY